MFLTDEPRNGKIILELDLQDCDTLGLACAHATTRLRAEKMLVDQATIERIEMMCVLFQLSWHLLRKNKTDGSEATL